MNTSINGLMELTTAISNLQQSRLTGQIQIAVARRVLDASKAQGAAAVKLIQAASGGVSRAGDQLVAAATGLGGNVDTVA